jgi:hypothetical protein
LQSLKKIPLCLAIFIHTGSAYSNADSYLVRDRSDAAGFKNHLIVSDNRRTIRKTIYLVGQDNPSPKQVIYIFHGYKPKGDPYKQSPAYFIKNWQLGDMAAKFSVLFVLPDNGDSVYPISRINEPLSDMGTLEILHRIIREKFSSAGRELSIGFSAGVEGAVKFAIINDINEIVAISGNFDLHSIPAGEMSFHIKSFGTEKDILERENPITLLRKNPKTIYLFCEEKNDANVRQSQALIDAAIPGIRIIDFRSLGKGFGHDWSFLTSPGVIGNLEKIISGEAHAPDGK